MKKIIEKIKKSLHNTGSSLILVIVALAFMGIITGALLTAVGYVYRQKLYDYNARSNFYYLDQAMDEIYSGIGSLTMNDLMEAYQKTREEIIFFDPSKKTYVNMSEADANQKFKDNFAKELAQDVSFQKNPSTGKYDKLIDVIGNSITNSTIELIDDDLAVKYVYLITDDSNNQKAVYKDIITNSDDASKLAKIVIQNVKLRRTAKYERSTAKGSFQQTISTDIEITRPDFNISFNNNTVDINDLFEYCLIADSGVDFDRISTDILTISGNVYAANDFYNKDYNSYGNSKYNTYSEDITYTYGDGTTKDFKMNKVSNYNYTDDTTNNLYNRGRYFNNNEADDDLYKANNLYNGKNPKSKYSGFYIDGGRVSILADKVIVPGSISVMNGGSLAIYGLNSGELSATNVWTDEVVLGGYSLPTTNENIKKGSSAVFNSNLYVKDDTTIDAEFSRLKLDGAYYGFGNSEQPDARSFIPTTAKEKSTDTANIYQEMVPDRNDDGSVKKDSLGNIIYKKNEKNDTYYNRGHYNSSAIIVNGQHTNLDLSTTKSIFIAGRSYIELSNTKVSTAERKDDITKGRGTRVDATSKSTTYQYDPYISDYKTGESISVKSSQLAYYPNKASGKIIDVQAGARYAGHEYKAGKYFELSSTSRLKTMRLIMKYFGQDGLIPLSVQEEIVGTGTDQKKKIYHYIDFEQAVRNMYFNTTKFSSDPTSDKYIPSTYSTTVEQNITKYADILKQSFIKDYFDYFNFCINADSPYKLDYIGYEDGYDDSKYSAVSRLGDTDFDNKYRDTGLDRTILEVATAATIDREEVNKTAAELQNVTNYADFIAGQIAVPDENVTAINPTTVYTSGAITKTGKVIDSTIDYDKNVEFSVTIDNDSNISGNLEGETSINTANDVNTKEFVEKTNKHYNYVKMLLKDVDSGSLEAQFVDSLVASNGEAGITPINYYMNYDKVATLDHSTGNDINPGNLNLGQYMVWASNGDVTIDKAVTGTEEVTGIVVAMGDVYFKDISRFNGLIMTGGKVYIGTNNASLDTISSTTLCRNIMNEVLSKASVYDPTAAPGDEQTWANNAIKFLSLFKSYEEVAEKAKNGDYAPDDTARNITSINYSDVIKYNNWMRNVD